MTFKKRDSVMAFMTDSFLLSSRRSEQLFHDYADSMPIYDYHTHLPARKIAENNPFRSITEVWLDHDHYKWRAMRAEGIDERLITGAAADWDRFLAWAGTVPRTLRNPLFHWTHLELKAYFGIRGKLLGEDTAQEIYARCNELLQTDDFRPRSLLERMKVRVLFTTDDPTDSLEHHLRLQEDGDFDVKVLPTFRPDPVLGIEEPAPFNRWVSRLEAASGIEVKSFDHLLQALEKRHDDFHAAGCRASDYGLDRPYCESYSKGEIQSTFKRVRRDEVPDVPSIEKFRTCLLAHLSWMNRKRGWVQMLHLGALRNTSSRRFRSLGPDTGFDAMGDAPLTARLLSFLDRLESGGMLPKTVVFNINPRDNDAIMSAIGCFQEGPVRGKMQLGPAWWFNDSREGVIAHLNALSDGGMLSGFIGMVTDSRSFLSFPRHEYFRRIFCNLLGEEMEGGLIPDDLGPVGDMVRDVCYHNAETYFEAP
jgi:glucuronate isomerase